MDMREKLIELMIEAKNAYIAKKAHTGSALFSEFLADFLVSNGVTVQANAHQHESNTHNALTNTHNALNGVAVQRWIPVEERLPPNGDDVLCWYEYYRYGEHNCMFQRQGIGHCMNGYWGGEVMVGTDCRVLKWMPLPKPPKEDV